MAGPWDYSRGYPPPAGGNLLTSSPPMAQPPWDQSGRIPGNPPARLADAWSDQQGQQFKSDGTNQVWEYVSPLFDLRPGQQSANLLGPVNAVPINHEAALGQAVYLTLLICSPGGASPPAIIPGMTCYYWEDGNPNSSQPIYRLTEDIEITDIMQAGSTRVTVPFGGSALSFTPSMPAMRFWRVGIRLTIPGVAAVTNDLMILGALH